MGVVRCVASSDAIITPNSSIPQYRLHLRSALQPEALPNQRRSSPWRHRQRTRLKNVLLQPSGEQVQLTPGLTGSLAL